MARLYHYTTAAGLKGIVEGRSIWASDYRFLNDSQEFRHGMIMLRKVILSRANDLRPIERGVLYGSLTNLLDVFSDPAQDVLETLSIFIASFSEAPDLLSQWRGYNGGKGYSIGVDHEWLEDCVRNSLFALAPVLYDEKLQSAALNDRVDQLIGSVESAPDDISQVLQFWFQLVFQTVAYCKHPAFVEEQEFRS